MTNAKEAEGTIDTAVADAMVAVAADIIEAIQGAWRSLPPSLEAVIRTREARPRRTVRTELARPSDEIEPLYPRRDAHRLY